jgi:hypothetical protein
MTPPRRFVARPFALVVATSLAAAACGSSESTSETIPDTAMAVEGVIDTAAPVEDEAAVVTAESEPIDTAVVTAAVADATAPADSGGSSDDVVLTLDDGRTWTLTKGTCTFDPDAAGPAAAVINIDGSDDAGVEIGVLEAWPLDGSTDKGTPFLGTFVDENDDVLIFEKDGAAMVGDAFEVTGTFYSDVFYQDGDEPDGTYTISCQP